MEKKSTPQPTSDILLNPPKIKSKERLALEQANREQLDAERRILHPELTFDQIGDILSYTVRGKGDLETAKITTAIGLLNYTDSYQQNALMKADSSTGKTYITKAVLDFFPDTSKLELFNVTSKAFFWLRGDYDEELDETTIDLHQKIIVLYDQRDLELLKQLRPILSHDKKELTTYRTQGKSKGFKAKTIKVKGYCTLIVCSADKRIMDSQELTRFFILSPETSQTKLKEALRLQTESMCNTAEYNLSLSQNADRTALKSRIVSVANAQISDVIIPLDLSIPMHDNFLADHGYLSARNLRDYPRLIALIKAHALLNYKHRKIKKIGSEKHVIANSTDLGQGKKLYDYIAQSNELGLSPEIYEIWVRVIQPFLKPHLTLANIRQNHFRILHRSISGRKLKETLTNLVAVGLIVEDRLPEDKRIVIYYEALETIYPEGGEG